MIKLQITRYRDFTEEENKAREDWKKETNQYGIMSKYDNLTPVGVEKYFEAVLESEITDEQFEVIRKAVLEKF